MAKRRAKEPEEPKVCAHCDGAPETSLDLWEPNDPLIVSFTVVARLKYGARVACPKCRAHWYRWEPHDTVSMRYLTPDDDALLDAWNAQTRMLTDAQCEALREIRGIRGDAYGNGVEYLRVPCVVTDAAGRAHDLSTVAISRIPPFGFPEARWVEESDQFSPSRYAIPARLRWLASQTYERETVSARAPDGSSVTVPTNGFYATETVRGSELVEATTGKKKAAKAKRVKGAETVKEKPKTEPLPTEPPVLCWVDWDERCEALVIAEE